MKRIFSIVFASCLVQIINAQLSTHESPISFQFKENGMTQQRKLIKK